ncbi:MAG: UbiD family decarboxylase [Thermodesulfobacteriota bacterium]|nr:UbiD family decarboxylase [Thermodesulfobacteriota bacterium]
MAFNDLREFINKLEQEGELCRIQEEVDWNLEIGGIIRRVYDLGAPAPLFENIKDYTGFRIFGAPAGFSSIPKRKFARLALSYGLTPNADAEEIIENYLAKKKNPIKPVMVKGGHCKENVLLGDDIDLFKFPVPFIHEGDGGRYIGTWHTVATKDPDSDWVNWGMYRLMVHDKNSMGGVLVPHQNIGMMYYGKYEPGNMTMPFAAALGTEPITPLMGCSFIPVGVSEADIIGGLRGEPLELVKCETNDLYVPASTEIVIEGEVRPFERRDEGPFGEYVGYRAGMKSPKPVYRVKAITFRNNAILPVSNMGVPVDDGAAAMHLTVSGDILEQLRSVNFPVRMVYCPPHAVTHMAVVSTKVPYPNFAKKVAHAVWGNRPGEFMYYVIVVEDDVDVTNFDEVLHSLTTRCHPQRGIYSVPNAPAYPVLLPFLDPDDRARGKGAYVLFDCTFPTDWPKEAIPVKASFDVLWPEDIQDKILKKWTKYGFKDI